MEVSDLEPVPSVLLPTRLTGVGPRDRYLGEDNSSVKTLFRCSWNLKGVPERPACLTVGSSIPVGSASVTTASAPVLF